MNKFVSLMTLPLDSSLETKKYHQTGLVDKWLMTVLQSPPINFLKDYLMIGDVVMEHVLCLVELECTEVCTLLFHDFLIYSDAMTSMKTLYILVFLKCTSGKPIYKGSL